MPAAKCSLEGCTVLAGCRSLILGGFGARELKGCCTQHLATVLWLLSVVLYYPL